MRPRLIPHRLARGALVVLLAALVFGSGAAIASAAAPWEQAEEVRSGLFKAQTDLLLDGGAKASAEVDAAGAAVTGKLERELRSSSPSSLADLRAAIRAAGDAAAAGDEVALAAARGRALGAMRRGAFAVAVDATEAGDVERARGWLLIRDFRQATRFTRPGVDATTALDELETGETSAAEAVTGVRKDLLDAYQARLFTYVDDATQASERGFAPAFAENAAIAAGYWPLLAGEYESLRGAEARSQTDRDFAALAATAARGDAAGFAEARERVLADVDGFTAAPLTPDEQVRRAQQLIRFLDLIPVEYDRGTEDGEVTLDFEIQEAVAFTEGAQAAFTDLEGILTERDPAAVETIEGALNELDTITTEAIEGTAVASQDDIESAHDTASDTLDAAFPDEWKESSSDADFDLIEISLDQMEAAINAGEREQAEGARLSAYAFFEFGPERLLRGLDPQLTTEIEGYVWYGADGKSGLAELIADDGSARDVRETRLALDEALERAKGTTGEGASGITVITNAALIVFREGLEAILIIAAITASMVGSNRRLRKPILRGALLGLPASAVMFGIAVLLLDQLSRYGEKLEAVVGLVAIAILLLVLNWFFHKVYWTEWIAGHRKRGKTLAGAAAGGVAAGATVFGLYMLGFTSVFREGFETVLFLQALQLESGTGIVLAGVGLGLLGVAAVGAVTFKLEQKLPYKKMLIVTGILISLVLVVMVGNTMRTLQGVGWASITPIDVDFPLWMGTWLGIFPTWETIGAQLAALVFVIGSYFAAEWVRKRSVRKAIAAAEEQFPEEGERQPLAANGGGNGNGRPEGNGKPNGSAPADIDLRKTPQRLPEQERERS
jgi:high-affinity iron transporter